MSTGFGVKFRLKATRFEPIGKALDRIEHRFLLACCDVDIRRGLGVRFLDEFEWVSSVALRAVHGAENVTETQPLIVTTQSETAAWDIDCWTDGTDEGIKIRMHKSIIHSPKAAHGNADDGSIFAA